MTDTQTFDAIVIGAGGAGDPLARDLANAGKRTLLVERDKPGGTCTNTGCTPSKTAEASARIAHLARNARQWGIEVGEVRTNLTAVQKHKDSIIDCYRNDTQQAFDETPNLRQVLGEARFTAPGQVAVRHRSGDEFAATAPIVVVNTGTRPAVPSVEGIESVPYWNSTDALNATALPEHLLVLGGNYIGVELAQTFCRFGSRVTLVESGPHILPNEDEDIAQGVTEALQNEGITFRIGARAVRISGDAGQMRLELEDGEILTGTHLLGATGRNPNTEALNLSLAGVQTNEAGFVQTNARLETSAPGVWAAGDVAGSPQFSHIAFDDYRVLKSQLLGDGARTTEGRLVPYVVYTDPPLGRVGLSETEAKHQNRRYKIATVPMTEAAFPIENNETTGLVKVLIDLDTDRLLGAACFGLQGDALSTVVHTAMLGGVTARQLSEATFAHPTLAETMGDLLCRAG